MSQDARRILRASSRDTWDKRLSRFPQLTGGVCEQGLSNAWELIDTDEAVRSVRYLLSYQRQADGAFPQQVSPTGATMFGQEGELPRYHCHSPQDGSDIRCQQAAI